MDEMQNRLSNTPEMMLLRKQKVECPFEALKQRMGATHFLARELNKVSAKINLNILDYNLKRVMKALVTCGLIKSPSA
ncbi:hypothetical protein SAMN03159391_03314 [Pseudomonas sp. NFACC37-1]|nr:hypothetical protein SAMN03159391_03314 [Pseudomonas sp. NFACC37-1]SFO81843.1 hypothetical protein SAMN03159304_05178 [Pseudomonas sp. NFACC24-1]